MPYRVPRVDVTSGIEAPALESGVITEDFSDLRRLLSQQKTSLVTKHFGCANQAKGRNIAELVGFETPGVNMVILDHHLGGLSQVKKLLEFASRTLNLAGFVVDPVFKKRPTSGFTRVESQQTGRKPVGSVPFLPCQSEERVLYQFVCPLVVWRIA